MDKTCITAELRRSDTSFSFSLSGHARPQVCAAVSATACGLVSFCRSYQHKIRGFRYKLESGDSLVKFESDDEFVKGAFTMAEIALLGIQEGYPEDLKVICDP